LNFFQQNLLKIAVQKKENFFNLPNKSVTFLQYFFSASIRVVFLAPKPLENEE